MSEQSPARQTRARRCVGALPLAGLRPLREGRDRLAQVREALRADRCRCHLADDHEAACRRIPDPLL
ncbi:MAG TPA: hypothetical protein VGF12_01375 [Roseateles sp.]|uniref:hypothetical protein n=1 Tax=Roseateles sp. TaxID=1971397 RepID=UPI002ED9FDA9